MLLELRPEVSTMPTAPMPAAIMPAVPTDAGSVKESATMSANICMESR